MKRKAILSLSFISLAAVVILAYVFIFSRNSEYISDMDEKEVAAAYDLLTNSLRTREIRYIDFMDTGTYEYGKSDYQAAPETGTVTEGYDGTALTVDYGQSVLYNIEVTEPGLYYLALDYKPMEKSLAEFNVDIKINDTQPYEEMKNIVLPLYWSDETKDYPTDRYGDETAPYQYNKDIWSTVHFYNNTYNTSDPLLFLFEEGSNIVKITNISGDGLGLGTLTLEAPVFDTPSYAQYRESHSGELVNDLITVNSIDYIEKNSTQVIYSSENNPALVPHDSEYKLLNALTWNEAGIEVTYELDVPRDGLYQIAFHYRNNKEEFDVFETIRLDGVIPFQELQNYPFPSTGSSWANETLSDSQGTPYEIYLTKGIHTLSLRGEQEPIVKAWHYARLISEHVTQFDMDIKKITGAAQDKERTWQMTRYIPEIPDYLKAYKTLIDYIKYSLQNNTPNGINSAILSELDKAVAFLVEMEEYPDEIALYRTNLTSARDNSVLKSMSTFTSEIITQEFSLDRIYLYGNRELPREKATIFRALGNSLQSLLYSFTSDKFKLDKEEDAVNIWVNRAATHVDLLQKMVDTEFTPETGIKVKISIMPDANKLTLATAADESPDIALGLGSFIPFELASRGALYDMTQFEDFWQIQSRFVPGSSVSFIYNEGMYAVPETLNFSSLIYRTDIFESLGLDPPDTWDDVKNILPTLQRYGMNFYHNISSGVGYKWYYQTSALIFQNNGRLYTDDGLRAAIDQPNAVKGVQALGDLFIAYSLPKEVISFFNSFRYSTLPVGLVDINDYILIKNGATELDGKWALSAYPGTVQEDGSIARWYIVNGNTAGVIFKDSGKIEESWEFLKWWTDYETQVNYTYTLRSTYGKTFVWLPSNIDAIADAPFDQADKQMILEQIKWLRDVPRTPGQYLLERDMSDIWNEMVNEGTSAQVAIDEKVIGINREIRRKMKELGFYDEEGNLLKPYVIHDVDWIIEQTEKAKQEGTK